MTNREAQNMIQHLHLATNSLNTLVKTYLQNEFPNGKEKAEVRQQIRTEKRQIDLLIERLNI